MDSVGEFFRQVRETKGLTIDEVALKTRIRTDFVKALEDWKKLLKVSIAGTTNMDVTETRELYIAGDVFGTIDWGDVPELSAADPQSKIKGHFATIINPLVPTSKRCTIP